MGGMPQPLLPLEAVSRRTVLVAALGAAGLWGAQRARALVAPPPVVGNVTGLYAVTVAAVLVPRGVGEVVAAVRGYPGRIAIGGGRYSMGGQVGISDGLHLDMRSMARVLWVDAQARTARVQAGTRWRDLQDVLDPLSLAVRTMQSYANFTVGGSVSVNAHGRYVGHGPLGHSVRALQLVLADGHVVEVDRQRRPELFRAAVGGYGAVGVITEVELDLAENVRIERVVAEVPLASYLDHFDRHVRGDADAILHNADLVPPNFDAPVSVTWRRTGKPLTEIARLVPRGQSYALEQNVMWALTELPGGSKLRRAVIHPLLTARPSVKWLNHEASLDVAELEPRSRRDSTYVLQEYFVPRRGFLPFAQALAGLLRQRRTGAVNVSIRHAPADTVSMLPWAREEVFSFVLYYKQGTGAGAREAVGRWTRELIDLALAQGGCYYLPYQLHATPAQFRAAYPGLAALRATKAQVDPQARFMNELWARYLNS
jgi:FAD/FMN-containing dehydrogenase